VDEVDESDRVIGVVTRRDLRERRVRHRCVFVVVRDSAGRVLVHRRADHKDIWPGWWDLAAGGVLGSGESYDDAAVRELAEELGISGVVLRRFGRGSYESDTVAERAAMYGVSWDGPIEFADGEVAEARWVTVGELGQMIDTMPFVPDSVTLVWPLVHPVIT
jgi:isopentenyldiphosphate isomerase